jgi:hypothetical protein
MDREQAREEYLRRSRRKKMGRMGPSKPTIMGKIEERPQMTRGMIERRKEMERRRNILRERKRQERLFTKPGMLTGGQAKLDKNKNGKIDAQDFKILKAEKAKGRGKGLQDEKMKPGRVMKADKGGMGDATKYKKYLKGLKKATGKAPVKAGTVGISSKSLDKQLMKTKNPYSDLKKTTEKGPKTFIQRRMQLGGARALEAAKATRIGKIAAGVAGAALLAKAGLEKMYEKRTGKKPFTKRPAKKMGGGMMMRPNPVGYSKGVMVKTKIGRNKPTKMY